LGTTNVRHIELTATPTAGSAAKSTTTEATAATTAKVAAGRTTDETRLGLTILQLEESVLALHPQAPPQNYGIDVLRGRKRGGPSNFGC
jgi:hypothetical protein